MSADADWLATARSVLNRYAFAPRRLSRIAQGLINLTVRVTASDGTHYVLQRLHPVFGDSVNLNLERVTAHLAGRGVFTPRLVRTRDGALSVVVDGAVWRVLSHVAGRSYDALPGLPEAAAAGRLLGRFHVALADFDEPLVVERPAVHDLPRHLAHLGVVEQRLQVVGLLAQPQPFGVVPRQALQARVLLPEAREALRVLGDGRVGKLGGDLFAAVGETTDLVEEIRAHAVGAGRR